MRSLLIVFLIFASQICQGQTKTVFENNSTLTKSTKLEKLDAYSPNKSVIVFTDGYWGDTVHIIIGEKVISKSVITIPQIGFANLEIVLNDSDVKISFRDGSNQEIILNKTDLKKYKYAYISKGNTKENKKIQIIYSNETKYSF